MEARRGRTHPGSESRKREEKQVVYVLKYRYCTFIYVPYIWVVKYIGYKTSVTKHVKRSEP